MKKLYKKMLFLSILCVICMGIFGSAHVLAQNSNRVYYESVSRSDSKTPQIKTNIQPYRPLLGFIPYNNFLVSPAKATLHKSEKILTVVKVFPNPIDDQINITFKLERESLLSIKIMDLLGNEVITLANERFPAGESTKNYMIPNRLNSGIYFLRIVCGGETNVKRISVL
ncbi:T9SS type A sorting domain-containing protein [Pedobacter sp.]|uniref:T9SS type A sorting domain-containing protein n=1 Tax=Pedobacter sp. TaxID=1411316 RepID=UPI003D7F19EA